MKILFVILKIPSTICLQSGPGLLGLRCLLFAFTDASNRTENKWELNGVYKKKIWTGVFETRVWRFLVFSLLLSLLLSLLGFVGRRSVFVDCHSRPAGGEEENKTRVLFKYRSHCYLFTIESKETLPSSSDSSSSLCVKRDGVEHNNHLFSQGLTK